MTNFTSMELNVTDSIPVSEIQYEYNGTGPLNSTSPSSKDSSQQLAKIFIFFICTFGIIGNSLVIWLLSFCIKRNPFTTYVLNLSVADLGFLITDWIIFNPVSPIFGNSLLLNIIHFMYSASQYFLTVISIDRCVSIFFPFWYHLNRQKHLSVVVCALLWGVSFLPPGIACIMYKDEKNLNPILWYQVIVSGALCLPLMFISSLLLFSKVRSKLGQRKQRRPLIMILVTVLCFLIFYFLVIIKYISQIQFPPFSDDISACLNSSINPIIYGLIGRPKKGCSMKDLSTMLQGLFSGEDLSVKSEEKVKITLE